MNAARSVFAWRLYFFFGLVVHVEGNANYKKYWLRVDAGHDIS